jgi:hypothetical protein
MDNQRIFYEFQIEISPNYGSPIRIRQPKKVHGNGETEEALENDRFATNDV